MKEKIQKALLELGFTLEELEGFGFAFKYEGYNYMFNLPDNDENFISLIVPGLVEKDELPLPYYHGLIDNVNSTLKYVKAYDCNDNLWLCYERELIKNEEDDEEYLKALLTHMIMHLESGAYYTHRKRNEFENSSNEEDENEDDFELPDLEEIEDVDEIDEIENIDESDDEETER